MSSALRPRFIPVNEYLQGECDAAHKQEYVAGFVYAMAGGSNAHNAVASNVLGLLHAQLRGNPCSVFNSDTKIRIRQATSTRFYYPDVSVVCRHNPPLDTFQDEPVVIVEVLSDGTRRIDEGEKRDAYLAISTLSTYLLLEQASANATVFRRKEQGFDCQVFAGQEAQIVLPDIQAVLKLSDVYEGVELHKKGNQP